MAVTGRPEADGDQVTGRPEAAAPRGRPARGPRSRCVPGGLVARGPGAEDARGGTRVRAVGEAAAPVRRGRAPRVVNAPPAPGAAGHFLGPSRRLRSGALGDGAGARGAWKALVPLSPLSPGPPVPRASRGWAAPSSRREPPHAASSSRRGPAAPRSDGLGVPGDPEGERTAWRRTCRCSGLSVGLSPAPGVSGRPGKRLAPFTRRVSCSPPGGP